MDDTYLSVNRSSLISKDLKTGEQWADLYGLMILDCDGFGERLPDRPVSTELMDESMFHKCILESTVHIFERESWTAMFKKYRG